MTRLEADREGSAGVRSFAPRSSMVAIANPRVLAE
jgi:hypothetical protein